MRVCGAWTTYCTSKLPSFLPRQFHPNYNKVQEMGGKKTLIVILILLGINSRFIKSGHLAIKRCTATGELKTRVGQTIDKTVKSVNSLHSFIRDPGNVCSLILSHGNVGYLRKGLFYNFTSLIELSLVNSNISKISTNAFIGLASLETLNLSGNPIQQWNTSDILHETPHLTTLDMTTPSPWKPGDTLLSLPSLKTLRGLSWSPQCSMCSLVKLPNTSVLTQYANDTQHFIQAFACRLKLISPSKFVKGLAKHGFLATCLLDNQSLCFKSEIKVAVKAPCRETTLSAMYAEFALGPIAIIFNLLVIGTVITSKRLRQNHDMILVTNIAIGDLCNGIYSVAIISIHITKTFEEMEVIAQKYCTYVGCFWVLGVGLAAIFSLVLTIERYKCVVRSRNGKKMTVAELIIAMLFSWMFALSATLLPVFGIGSYSLNTYCIPVFPVKSMPVQYYYSITVSAVSLTSYLITVPLYIRMYLFVRKSSKKMRVRADIELAKRVFTLVITNMLFFLLPVILSLVFAKVRRSANTLSREASEILNSSLPLVCLTTNSVVNPTLYAFRSRLFRQEISKLRCKKRRRSQSRSVELNSVRSGSSALMSSPRGTSVSSY